MKNLLPILLVLLLSQCSLLSQPFPEMNDLYHSYESFREQTLKDKFIKLDNIIPLINDLKEDKRFEVRLAGKSLEGRDLYLIKYGTGGRKVFLWSQMHGDEPTATMALFDIFNFLMDIENRFPALRKLISENLSLYILPMVNPDGAEVFKRRNAMEIDLNRDALRLTTPEAQILNTCFDSIKADFGFNLHDQNYLSSAGPTFKQATLSFLAPAFNEEKEINPLRFRAIQLISEMTTNLSQYIPGHIGKYSDDFEPRAFGDNFQLKGTSTILIESGGWKNDPHKQFVRKLNFLTLINAFYSIATENYLNYDDKAYQNLPFNDEKLFDLILRNVLFDTGDSLRIVDLGISSPRGSRENSFRLNSGISEIGDLSTFYGLDEFDLSGYSAEPLSEERVKLFDYPIPEKDLNDVLVTNNRVLWKLKLNPVQQGNFPEYFLTISPPSPNQEVGFKLQNRGPVILKKEGKKPLFLMNGYLFSLSEFPNEKK
ncbi:MAG: M14 metallopeptidase family protein [Ignavibacteriaceae bacterium]